MDCWRNVGLKLGQDRLSLSASSDSTDRSCRCSFTLSRAKRLVHRALHSITTLVAGLEQLAATEAGGLACEGVLGTLAHRC